MKENNTLILGNKFDYKALLRKHPWVVEEKQKVIISPDVDGILCGLFMSQYYDWEIVGYYDGKKLAIKENVKTKECIFLDMEIYRSDIRSCGHHMVLYNKKNIPSNWNNFSNCISMNNLRGFDCYNKFQEKYPLAMIHFLLCAISSQKSAKMDLPMSAVTPLLYVDGTFKNLLNYPENCTSWLKFLNAKEPTSPIYPIFILFANRKLSTMIHGLEDLFGKIREIGGGKRGGDKIILSDISGNSFPDYSVKKNAKLLSMLSNLTGWKFYPERWAWKDLEVLNFSKDVEESLNNENYLGIMNKNPLSFAITATRRMEYTLEEPDTLS